MFELKNILQEEDLFPLHFTHSEKREYGFLFYNEDNKQSYDSNHALIYQSKVQDLASVLNEITEFYSRKGITPNIYQSIFDEGYFREQADVFHKQGYNVWEETDNFMILSEANMIEHNNQIKVERISSWDERFETEIFIRSGEPWEISVAKKMAELPECKFFIAYIDGIPVGMSYYHRSNQVCRFDYILVSAAARNKGVGRAIISYMTDDCRQNHIANCFQWPANSTSMTICKEAGFRTVKTIKAGRASYTKE